MRRIAFLLLIVLLGSCTTTKKDSTYYFNSAKHYQAEGDYVESARAISRAIAKDTAFVEAYMKRAEIWLFQDSFALAIKDYTKVITLRPTRNNGDIYALRGAVYYSSLQDTLACRDFRAACGLNHNGACDAIRKYCKK